MRSATREALASSVAALDALGEQVPLRTAQELFAAAAVLEGSAQLRAALADPSMQASAKTNLIAGLFASALSEQSVTLLGGIASARWSDQQDVLAGIEEVAIRAAARSTDAPVEDELFSFGAVVASDPDLELALGSKLGRPEAKGALVEALLTGKASEATLAIVRQIVVHARGRSVRVALRDAATVVADQAGLAIATVTVAAPLDAEQRHKVVAGLSERYGKRIKLNVSVDPQILGGMRIQVGDEVIDGSVSRRLAELRLRLAG